MIHEAKPYAKYKDSGVPWLGKIPADWAVTKLKRLATMKSGDNITALSIGEAGDYPVYGGNGLRGYATSYTHDGTFILVGRQGALCGNVHLVRGKFWASEHAVVTTARHGNNTEWLAYVLRMMNLNQYSESAAQPGISVEKILNLKVPLPKCAEQREIATVIHAASLRVNRFIRNKRKLIALLREQKQAIINQALTRGIDPNVKLKPSGIPWLGDIPEHWQVRRLKHIFRELDERTDTGTETLFSMRLHAGLVRHDSVSDRPVSAQELVGYKRVYAGQMVMNRMRACIGMFASVRELGLVSPDYAIFKPIAGINLEYFIHLFKSPPMKAAFRIESKGLGTGEAGFLRLYTDRFGRIRAPIPHRTEQDSIVAWLKEKSKNADAAIARAEREIELMNEYRTRLIADVVTGKVDVRDVVVPDDLPTEEAVDESPFEEEVELAEVEDEVSDGD